MSIIPTSLREVRGGAGEGREQAGHQMAPNQGGRLPALGTVPARVQRAKGTQRRWEQQGAEEPPGRKGPALRPPRPPCGRNPTEGVRTGGFCTQS